MRRVLYTLGDQIIEDNIHIQTDVENYPMGTDTTAEPLQGWSDSIVASALNGTIYNTTGLVRTPFSGYPDLDRNFSYLLECDITFTKTGGGVLLSFGTISNDGRSSVWWTITTGSSKSYVTLTANVTVGVKTTTVSSSFSVTEGTSALPLNKALRLGIKFSKEKKVSAYLKNGASTLVATAESELQLATETLHVDKFRFTVTNSARIEAYTINTFADMERNVTDAIGTPGDPLPVIPPDTPSPYANTATPIDVYSTLPNQTGYVKYDTTGKHIDFRSVTGIWNAGKELEGYIDNIALTHVYTYWDGWLSEGMYVEEGTDTSGLFYNRIVCPADRLSSLTKTIEFDTLTEFKFARIINDASKIFVYIDGNLAWAIQGLTAWFDSVPIKVQQGTHEIKIVHDARGIADIAMLDHLRIRPYRIIECLFKGSTPFYQAVEPQDHAILRSYTVFQQSNLGHASSEFALLFYSHADYFDFMLHSNAIFVVQDEIGILYRGVLKCDKPEKIGENSIYYIDCEFNSPYQTGVGW